MVNMKTPFIIAEVGSNFRNNFTLAECQIMRARECGASAVKFQFFTHEDLYGLPGKMDFELPLEWVERLSQTAREVGIEFMCSAFSAKGYGLVNPYVSRHKIASSEALDPIIRETVLAIGKPYIVSVGALSELEVQEVLRYEPEAVLECVTNYPANACDYNLAAMKSWQRPGVTAVGISDHTKNSSLAALAIAYGATVFEKHFDVSIDTVEFSNTPDSPVSVGVEQFTEYVNTIRSGFELNGTLRESRPKSPAHQHQSMLKYRRRPILTRDAVPGTVLELGINYGNYRSLIDDTRGAPAQSVLEFDRRVLKREMKAGEALWFTDLE